MAATAKPSSGAIPRAPELDYFNIITRNNIFNPDAAPEPSKPVSASVTPRQESIAKEADAPKTELKLTLRGTAVAEDPLYSFAVCA